MSLGNAAIKANAAREAQSFKKPLGKTKTKPKAPKKPETKPKKTVSKLTVAEQQKQRRQKSSLLTIEITKAQKEKLTQRAAEEGTTLKALVLEALNLS